jgi:O-antigen biosynthesis protein
LKVFNISSSSLSLASNVSVEGGRFTALSPEPWLGIKADGLFENGALQKGVWIELIYSSSYFDKPVRPILRCIMQDNHHDEILPAPVFGRAIWRGYVPAGTVSLQISPINQLGSLSFRIESLRVMSRAEVLARAFVKRPRKAVLGLLSRIGGYRYLAHVNLRHALGATPFADYDAWRKQRLRAFESNGFDGGIVCDTPIILMCECDATHKDWVLKFIRELQAQPYKYWQLYVSGVDVFDVKDVRVRFDNSPHPILLSKAVIEHKWEREEEQDALVMNVPVGARLAPYALSVLAHAAFEHSKVDVFYADCDEINAQGKHHTPRFLPDFDPLLFESNDYLGEAVCVRARVLGDLTLAELREKLPTMNLPVEAYCHVARVVMSVCGYNAQKKPLSPPVGYPLPQGERAVNHKHRDREICTSPLAGEGVRRTGEGYITRASIIIPTKNQFTVFKRCIESIIKFSNMSLVELIIVDNGSSEPDAVTYLKALEAQGFKVLYRPEPFNFSKLCNYGAAIASADFLIFLNNDTEITHENWIERLVYFASHPHVGAVGAKLLYADRRLQHGGVILGLDGRAGHFERLIGEHDAGYFGRLNAPHEIATVTGACLAVETSKFQAIGGFDEVNLPVDLNDIDLCLRLVEKGWKCVLASDVVILHHESVSRSGSWRPDEVYSLERTYFKKRWIHELRTSPSFHPALTLEGFRAALG